jgi:hypothetical protein
MAGKVTLYLIFTYSTLPQVTLLFYCSKACLTLTGGFYNLLLIPELFHHAYTVLMVSNNFLSASRSFSNNVLCTCYLQNESFHNRVREMIFF